MQCLREPDALSFFLDGNQISPDATLAELRLKDDNLVDVVLTVCFAYWRSNTKRMLACYN